MGLYDIVIVPCPVCLTEAGFQSKSGYCMMLRFKLSDCPVEVLDDVNRHSPHTCEKCKSLFEVVFVDNQPKSSLVKETVSWCGALEQNLSEPATISVNSVKHVSDNEKGSDNLLQDVRVDLGVDLAGPIWYAVGSIFAFPLIAIIFIFLALFLILVWPIAPVLCYMHRRSEIQRIRCIGKAKL